MHNDLLISIALIIGSGMFAQWVAWRLKMPSILFLLLIGLFIGPISATLFEEPLLDVEHMLGELLFPFISAAVAIILFEGGLSLRVRDLRGAGNVVRNLVTVGVVVTWGISAVAAYFIFDLELGLSMLLGATLVVTGPTVIIPLLQQIRPRGRVGSILRWEGIVIDPIGAILALLVFEEVITEPSWVGAFITLGKTLLIGGIIGWITAQIMIELYRRFWVPDTLQNATTLGFVVAAFTLSNILQAEAGLLTVTIMGIVMANQNRFNIREIVEFEETIQVLLLSTLFILLAARMTPEDLQQITWGTLLFVMIIIFVERPLAVWISTYNLGLDWKERLFLAWMAPRGIVAAAVISIFVVDLRAQGYTGVEPLVPYTFAVIIGTVTVYSLTSGRLARALGLSELDPQGLLVVGATDWVRAVALEVQEHGFRVLLVDTNQDHVNSAERAGLEVFHGNVLSDSLEDEVDFAGIGRLLAMTPNREVNVLAGEHYQHRFGTQSIFSLQHGNDGSNMDIPEHRGGRQLFEHRATYDVIEQLYKEGAHVMTITVNQPQALKPYLEESVMPMFVLQDDKTLTTWISKEPPTLNVEQRLVVMTSPDCYEELVTNGIISTPQTPAQ